MNEEILMQILEVLAKSSVTSGTEYGPSASPRKGYEVGAPSGPGRLGMSQDSQTMGNALSQLQESGIAPPMPGLMPEGESDNMELLLYELLNMLREQDLGQYRDVEATPLSDGTVGGSNELLRALIGGS